MDYQKWSLGFISLVFLLITSSSAELLIKQLLSIKICFSPMKKIIQVTEGRGIEYNNSYSLKTNLGILILKTETHFVDRTDKGIERRATIESEAFESSTFEAAGYKWRFMLFVNGNQNDPDGGHENMALYVGIKETESFPRGWEVNVDLKLFVHNEKLHKYLTVSDGTVKRYEAAKTYWGFGNLIPRTTLLDPNEGYILHDTLSFGAEISIVNPAEKQEKITFISNPPDNVFTWKILRFSTLENKFYYSDEFLVGDRYWLVVSNQIISKQLLKNVVKEENIFLVITVLSEYVIRRLGFNPKGYQGERPRALSIFLYAQGYKANAVITNTWGSVNLQLKNQRSSNHIQLYSEAWCAIRSGYGIEGNSIILLEDLQNSSKGYLVNDAIIFEAELVKVSVTNIVSA
ncbi:F9D12.3 gene product [Arabidopsis thaliana]|uniref:F9D12.3 protein n=1 Tax=Arabidopsis thaliana TaxID=3702 RepID=O81499_ARATH|nr:F9D12.3 gene product [Arabidopsis thaliana]